MNELQKINGTLMSQDLIQKFGFESILDIIKIYHGTISEMEKYPQLDAKPGDIILSCGIKLNKPIKFAVIDGQSLWLIDDVVVSPTAEQVMKSLKEGKMVRRSDIWLVYLPDLKIFSFLDIHRTWRKLPKFPSFINLPTKVILQTLMIEGLKGNRESVLFLLNTKQAVGSNQGQAVRFFVWDILPANDYLSEEDLALVKKIGMLYKQQLTDERIKEVMDIGDVDEMSDIKESPVISEDSLPF